MSDVIIIVDMLKGFLEKGHPLFCGDEARKIIPHVVSLLERKKDVPLLYVCDHHKKDDPEFKMFPPHSLEGTEEAEIIDELKPFPGKIIPKTTYSGFYQTKLGETLEEINPRKVILLGVCTDICIMYFAFELRIRDYEVEVPKECVATFNREAHDFALTHMEKVLGVKVV